MIVLNYTYHTGNLDVDTADEIMELLLYTAQELGKCVIVVTQSRKIADIADEIIQIRSGSIEMNDKIQN